MKDNEPRNPGPVGGYHLLILFHRILPKFFFDFLVSTGSLIAMAGMKPQRRSSRRYLRIVLGREPTPRDVWKHFNAFAKTLIFRLEVGSSKDPKLRLPHWDGEEFMALVRSHAQIFYGTFHIGCADLLGYELSEGFCPVYMIRLKKANSHDTEQFERSYQGVKLLWANDPQSVLLGIHSAVGEGASITMQCDRADYASRNEEFEFFGQKRLFPITIYHLSAIYKMPVAFCFAIYTGRHVETYAPKPFQPVGTKKEILNAGREHFQEVLRHVEQLLKDNPYQWFNFDEEEPEAHTGKEQNESHA